MQDMLLLSKRLTPHTGHDDRSPWCSSRSRTGSANTTMARLETKHLQFGGAGGNIFLGCAVETQQVPSVLCKISRPDRELITAFKCFWEAVSAQSLGPSLACERLQTRSGDSDLNTLTNFLRNAGFKAWEQASRNCHGRSEEMTRGRWKSEGKKENMCKGKMR